VEGAKNECHNMVQVDHSQEKQVNKLWITPGMRPVLGKKKEP